MNAQSELKGLSRRQALVHLGALAGLGAAWCVGLCDPALAMPQVIVVAGQDVTVSPQNPLVFDSGQTTQVTFGTITIMQGGYLAAVGSPLNLKADKLVKTS
jgi:hypothetical protein